MSTVPSDAEKPAPAAIMAEQEALPPGTRLGELEIQRVLGVGGFGIVYLARDHSLERDVALKEYMPASLATRGQGPQITVRSGALSETYAVGLRSFINEARLLAKFDHPSLVKVYRFWEDNATAYMVMPYLQGRTLREARRAMGAAPDEAWVRGVILPLLGALEVLHRDGVFHRDIAPDNILLPLEGPPVLLDFGAARRVISDRTQSLTAILKPSYAPIEQYAEMTAMRQGPWTDIYALGAVLHFVLVGTPPPPATARALHDEMVPLWTRNVPGVSQRLLAAVDWALAVRPQERPQNIEALRAVLDGRAEPPLLARTVPGATSLLPVGGTPATSGYEPTQAAPVRTEASVPPRPNAATATVPPLARPKPASAPAASVRNAAAPVAASAPAGSKKGLIGAAVALLLVLAGAGAWQWMGARDAAAPATATASSEPKAAPIVALPIPAAPVLSAVPAAPSPLTAAPVAAPPATTPEAARVSVPDAQPAPRPAPAADTSVAAVRPAARPIPRLPDPAPAPDASPPAVEPVATPVPEVRAEARARPRDTAAARLPPALLAATPATARAACGSRVLIALWNCIERECRRPRYAQQPECLEIADERRRRENP